MRAESGRVFTRRILPLTDGAVRGLRCRLNLMMLVIRDAQRAALQLDTDVRWFEGRLTQLYPAFAQAAASQRQQWVREGLARAKALGLTRAERLQFLCFEHTFFPGCLDTEAYAWARRLLVQPGVPPAERMKALRHETIHRLLHEEQAALQAAQAAELELAFPDPPDLSDPPEEPAGASAAAAAAQPEAAPGSLA